MTFSNLELALKALDVTAGKDGWFAPAAGSTISLHAAHDGASLSVTRIERLKLTDGMVVAQTEKLERVAVAAGAVFTISVDASSGGSGRQRAGFG
jgi:hypothetical protein